MNPKPTGYVRGNDLVLARTVQAPVEDVWASLTRAERTALWFGPWEGRAGPGEVVRLQLVHEKGQPWTDLAIEECEPPRRLVVRMQDDSGVWRIELTLRQAGPATELRLVQPLGDWTLAGDIGPGWEYYLDMLVAAREGKTLPSFDDYSPALKAHYLESRRIA